VYVYVYVYVYARSCVCTFMCMHMHVYVYVYDYVYVNVHVHVCAVLFTCAPQSLHNPVYCLNGSWGAATTEGQKYALADISALP